MGLLVLRPILLNIQEVTIFAGFSRFPGCEQIVTLTATIVGSSYGGQPVTWEQIGGNTAGVSFLTPINQLTVTYANQVPPGSFDDKTFRVYINKNTAIESFSDIIIYGTPATSIVMSRSTNNSKYTAVQFGSTGECRVPILEEITSLDFSSELPPGVYDSFLHWQVGCGEPIYYTLQHRANPSQPWELVINTTTQYYTLPLLVGHQYRILANYNDWDNVTALASNIVTIQQTTTQTSLIGDLTWISGIDTINFSNSQSSMKDSLISGYSAILLTLQMFGPVTSEISFSSGQSSMKDSLISGYSAILLTLQTFPPVDSTITFTTGYVSNKYTNITDYTISQQGGVIIGG